MDLPGFPQPSPSDGPLDTDDDSPTLVAGQIVRRRNPDAKGCKSPAIVLSRGRSTHGRSPAGLRVRILNTIVTYYWRTDNDTTPEALETHTQDSQEKAIELVSAAFHLPKVMPALLIGMAPEVQECRVVPAETFLTGAYRFDTDVHRLVIATEVCQLAGVA
jgi:hypothetical protein